MKKTAIIIAIAAAFAVNASAQTNVVTSSGPGKASVENTVDLTATIIAIDKTTRDITLKGPKGDWVVVTAGPEVKNFDEMKVGDTVHARYVEALVLELKKGSDLAVTRTEETTASGAKPGHSRTASLAVASPSLPMSSPSTAKRRLSRCRDRNSVQK